MARPRTQGPQTREKILEVALELFSDRGYDKASLRDIADRLGITKAALYYYFERKEDILLELHLRLHKFGSEMLAEFEKIPDGPDRVAAWPRVLDQLIDFLITNRDVMLLHVRNPGAIGALHANERNRLENELLEQRLLRILSSPAIPLDQRVRMSSSIGVITELFGDSGFAFVDVPPEELIALTRQVLSDVLRMPVT